MYSNQLTNRDYYGFFNKLCTEKRTGVLTVQYGENEIKVYLRKGVLVFTEGPDRDITFLEKIAGKKGLNTSQLSQLIQVSKRNPQSLGRLLIDLNLISHKVWSKFLILKAKYHLAAILNMERADLRFTENNFTISPLNSIDSNLIELIAETIRDIKNKAFFQKYITGPNIVFKLKSIKGEGVLKVPLTQVEQSVFSVIDGRKNVEGISSSLGLIYQDLYGVFYLLLFFDLIDYTEDNGLQEGGNSYREIIDLYIDFFKILEKNCRREVGRKFDAIFDQCKGELDSHNLKIFQGIDLKRIHDRKIKEAIYDRFSHLIGEGESPLLLSTSFNKFLYLLLMRMRKILGNMITENTIHEMITTVNYARKYRRDVEIFNYIKGNLEDYLKQIIP